MDRRLWRIVGLKAAPILVFGGFMLVCKAYIPVQIDLDDVYIDWR